ncbi:MAG TPA: VOC family protein [Solirubrobacteraceae bacterium]|nr:VOC family protein [Solirubrobacteraceae bacterium]
MSPRSARASFTASAAMSEPKPSSPSSPSRTRPSSLHDESPENGIFSPESLGGATVRMLLVSDDVEAAFERALGAGATVVRPLADQHGWRLGCVRDPFGHHWEIGRPLGAWPP